jgi:hypothetical protein
MSGARSKRDRLVFIGDAPTWYRKMWSSSAGHIDRIAKRAGTKVSKVVVHWHDDPAKGRACALGEADKDILTFCTHPADEDTFIHEVAHVATPGQHGPQWAECYYRLLKEFMSEGRVVCAVAEAMKNYPSVRKLVSFDDKEEA